MEVGEVHWTKGDPFVDRVMSLQNSISTHKTQYNNETT